MLHNEFTSCSSLLIVEVSTVSLLLILGLLIWGESNGLVSDVMSIGVSEWARLALLSVWRTGGVKLIDGGESWPFWMLSGRGGCEAARSSPWSCTWLGAGGLVAVSPWWDNGELGGSEAKKELATSGLLYCSIPSGDSTLVIFFQRSSLFPTSVTTVLLSVPTQFI